MWYSSAWPVTSYSLGEPNVAPVKNFGYELFCAHHFSPSKYRQTKIGIVLGMSHPSIGDLWLPGENAITDQN